jgi:hypothetical protein
VLSNEIKNLKKQVPELLKKNEHDNELIEALMVSFNLGLFVSSLAFCLLAAQILLM